MKGSSNTPAAGDLDALEEDDKKEINDKHQQEQITDHAKSRQRYNRNLRQYMFKMGSYTTCPLKSKAKADDKANEMGNQMVSIDICYFVIYIVTDSEIVRVAQDTC